MIKMLHKRNKKRRYSLHNFWPKTVLYQCTDKLLRFCYTFGVLTVYSSYKIKFTLSTLPSETKDVKKL